MCFYHDMIDIIILYNILSGKNIESIKHIKFIVKNVIHLNARNKLFLLT